ncbi:hypothetical protein [Nitrosopumilus sp.]|uniref:hypothetical protein n=1 Tax=Nitrosopumilus sp. TaxID=2024843 RepID=UPI003B5AADA2
MGYNLTVRQVYYQLVSRDIVPNNLGSYQLTSRVLKDARMSGLVDWDTIEDRVRQTIMPNEFDDVTEFINAAINSYRLPRWKDQDHYVEVIVEKEALAGILRPLTNRYHVLLLPNKGYSSASAIHEAAQRFIYQTSSEEKQCHILYLGDHDPSGMDMVRDIQDRLDELLCTVSVEKIALTMEQIKQYNPPPNLVKKSDSRSKKYVSEYGNKSWELDALKPEVLNELVESNIKKYLDMKKYDDVVSQEEREKLRLVELSSVV